MGGKVIFLKKFEGLEMRFSVKMNSSLLNKFSRHNNVMNLSFSNFKVERISM
jgi:hypothetical protein